MGCDEACLSTAELLVHPEALQVTAGDVGAHLSRWGEDPEADRVAAEDEQRAARVGESTDPLHGRFDDAEVVRALHQHRGDVVG